MLKINKVVKSDIKNNANMLFKNLASPIGVLHFDREASANELIAHYAKESALCKIEDDMEDAGNAYLSVALLLAFIERITSPSAKPSTIEEILDTEDATSEDMIAECVGIIARDIFEGRQDHADKYFIYLAVFVKMLLQEEGYDFPDDNDGPDEPDFSEYETEDNEKSVPEEKATPV